MLQFLIIRFLRDGDERIPEEGCPFVESIASCKLVMRVSGCWVRDLRFHGFGALDVRELHGVLEDVA